MGVDSVRPLHLVYEYIFFYMYYSYPESNSGTAGCGGKRLLSRMRQTCSRLSLLEEINNTKTSRHMCRWQAVAGNYTGGGRGGGGDGGGTRKL